MRYFCAAEMLTDLVRFLAYTRTEHSTLKVSWTNSTSREQRAGDFDLIRFRPSVYEAAPKQKNASPSAKSDPPPTHATETALPTWKMSWTDFDPQ